MQTRQQKRAEIAYSCVSSHNSNDKEEFSRLTKSFPALVHNSGLVQALAFVNAKDKEKESKPGAAYIRYLTKTMQLTGDPGLEERSRTADLIEYQQLSREAIEAATWLKRYSEAIFGSD
ncbi:type III-B CRISPR module-associated protein Cmr5 [Methanolacinia paynteri]|uniref:type III-B CRISPR module-associated protein Cmr5 n=1 Tax=Methanolacinia paynteri TaxID=230356 RepID=UPI00064F4F82|nr:type III-B CRISPR module-associated protein Cmr5 [Methanolacinia paynteri]